MLDKTRYYFAYGMNTPRTRFRRSQWIGPAILRDYELEFHVHAHVEPRKGAIVRGSLWAINEADLLDLDRQEGYPSYYTREIVTVDRGWKPNKDRREAICYLMNPQGYKQMKHEAPSRGYVETIRRGYIDAGHDTSHLERSLRRNINARQAYHRDREFYQYEEPDFDQPTPYWLDDDSLWPST